MDNKEGKPAKAWYVNWLIIAGTIIVIKVPSENQRICSPFSVNQGLSGV